MWWRISLILIGTGALLWLYADMVAKVKKLQKENDRILEDATKRPPRTAPVTEKNLEAYGWKIYSTKDQSVAFLYTFSLTHTKERGWLLCRDGLTDYISPTTIGQVIDFMEKHNET